MAEEIRAEMVANVWKVVKAVGDEVTDGETLVILESMKMEIPVLAESDGVIAQLAVLLRDAGQRGHGAVVGIAGAASLSILAVALTGLSIVKLVRSSRPAPRTAAS